MASLSKRGAKSVAVKEPPHYVSDPNALMAAEIIVGTINDWRLLIKSKAWLDTEHGSKYCNFDELRNFFRGDWCGFLMQKWESIDQTRLLQLLEEELQEAIKQHNAKRKGEK